MSELKKIFKFCLNLKNAVPKGFKDITNFRDHRIPTAHGNEK